MTRVRKTAAGVTHPRVNLMLYTSRLSNHTNRDRLSNHTNRDGQSNHTNRDGLSNHTNRDGLSNHTKRDGLSNHTNRDGLSSTPTQSLVRYASSVRLGHHNGLVNWPGYGSINVKCLTQGHFNAFPSLGTKPRVDNLAVKTCAFFAFIH